MVRKLRDEGVTDIAVMEVAQVGVRTRTRARAEAMEAVANSTLANNKRRKLNSDEVANISPCVQLRNRTIHNSAAETLSEYPCSSPGLELYDHHDRVSTSCCSSHGSSDERIEIVDLNQDTEVETSTYYGCRERRETTPSSEVEAEPEAEAGEESDGMDSTTNPSSEASSRRRSTVKKMPTESEIEEFFTEAETKLVTQFCDKYNFDFVKEEPMEGRYEWIRLRP